eukprot:Rmarinus@m.12568
MLKKATADRDNSLKKATTWAGFVNQLEAHNMVLVPWCDNIECEEAVKAKTKGSEATTGQTETGEVVESLGLAAKTLCKPLKQDPIDDKQMCFACDRKASTWVLFGRSY